MALNEMRQLVYCGRIMNFAIKGCMKYTKVYIDAIGYELGPNVITSTELYVALVEHRR